MSPTDKHALCEELLVALRAALDTAERTHHDSLEAATHAEARPENSKDTRALEQSYLARGQALRVEQARQAVAETSAMDLRALGDGAVIGMGALVTVDDDGASRRLFMAPHGGGTWLAGGRVQVVTPQAPLGAALLGRRVGDVCEVPVGGKLRELEITAVS